MTLTQGLLDRIAGLLNHDASNYTVFLQLYRDLDAGKVGDSDSLEGCVRRAVGADAEVGGSENINATDLLAEVNDALRHAGSPGAGPAESALESKDLSDSLAALACDVLALASQAETIKRFWFSAGHPAYPVFWEFAYAFLGNEVATIVVGSSSD